MPNYQQIPLPHGNPTIRSHIRLENGKLISQKNFKRFIARGDKDISRNVLGYGFTSEYREAYVIMSEPEGYIWREINHGMGINGHHRSLQDLIRCTCWIGGFVIEVLPVPIPQELFDSIKRHVAFKQTDYSLAEWGKYRASLQLNIL